MSHSPLFIWHLRVLLGQKAGPFPDEPLPSLTAFWREHGIGPYLFECGSPIPQVWKSSLRQLAIQAALLEPGLQLMLDEIGLLLAHPPLPALAVKGGSLAHLLYAKPYTRLRTDLDIWVHPTSQSQLFARLVQTGWHQVPDPGADLVRHQATFTKHTAHGQKQQLDVHWSMFDRPALRPFFQFETFYQRSQPLVPPLDPLRMPCDEDHALLVALHMAAHHPNQVRLLWVLDLFLLQQRLGKVAWKRVVQRLSEPALLPFSQFPLQLLDYGLGHLKQLAIPRAKTQWDRVKMDLSALGGVQKMVYLWQQAFPKPAFMLARFGATSRWLLPWLYLKRWSGGIAFLRRKWGARPK